MSKWWSNPGVEPERPGGTKYMRLALGILQQLENIAVERAIRPTSYFIRCSKMLENIYGRRRGRDSGDSSTALSWIKTYHCIIQ